MLPIGFCQTIEIPHGPSGKYPIYLVTYWWSPPQLAPSKCTLNIPYLGSPLSPCGFETLSMWWSGTTVGFISFISLLLVLPKSGITFLFCWACPLFKVGMKIQSLLLDHGSGHKSWKCFSFGRMRMSPCGWRGRSLWLPGTIKDRTTSESSRSVPSRESRGTVPVLEISRASYFC